MTLARFRCDCGRTIEAIAGAVVRCSCGRRMVREPNEPNRDAKKKGTAAGCSFMHNGEPVTRKPAADYA